MQAKLVGRAPAGWAVLCLVCAVVPSTASSWSQATHAYIADRVGARVGHDNLAETWGIVGPDLFNFIFDPDLCPSWVSDQTHGMANSETFMKVWEAASPGLERALAYGFVAHNQAWGADRTAHVAGRTFGLEGGYITTKSMDLLGTPSTLGAGRTIDDEFARLGMSAELRPLLAHLLTEYAIDIRLRNDVDPLLGRKLARAARGETRALPGLLVKAFGADYAAACFGGDESIAATALTDAEQQHREDMIFLGQAISQPEAVAVKLLAQQVAALLPGFMGPLQVPEAEAVQIVKAGLLSSLTVCDDYGNEIAATVEFVAQSLRDHGVRSVR